MGSESARKQRSFGLKKMKKFWPFLNDHPVIETLISKKVWTFLGFPVAAFIMFTCGCSFLLESRWVGTLSPASLSSNVISNSYSYVSFNWVAQILLSLHLRDLSWKTNSCWSFKVVSLSSESFYQSGLLIAEFYSELLLIAGCIGGWLESDYFETTSNFHSFRVVWGGIKSQILQTSCRQDNPVKKKRIYR